MGVGLGTRLRWFDRGATAFEHFQPGELERQLGKGCGPRYVCPTCEPLRAFSRRTVETKELTAEHVPPRSFGGRELLLTCKRCNNTAGSELDSQARRKENPLDLLTGVALNEPLWIKLNHGGREVNATLTLSDGCYVLEVLKQHNHPDAVTAFRDVGPPRSDSPLNVGFDGDRYFEHPARVSWLRSAYLAIFSVTGYGVALDPAMGIVRRQIADPKTRLIEHFTITNPAKTPWTSRAVMEIQRPQDLRGFGVQFGRYMILLPYPGDMEFYSRVQEAAVAEPKTCAKLEGRVFEWPTEPNFGVATT